MVTSGMNKLKMLRRRANAHKHGLVLKKTRARPSPEQAAFDVELFCIFVEIVRHCDAALALISVCPLRHREMMARRAADDAEDILAEAYLRIATRKDRKKGDHRNDR